MDTIINILREIKWAYQRVRYGYDDTMMWNLDIYLEQFLPAIRKFCENELREDNGCNPHRIEIFQKTLILMQAYNAARFKDYKTYDVLAERDTQSKLWEYIGKHISYYWD